MPVTVIDVHVGYQQHVRFDFEQGALAPGLPVDDGTLIPVAPVVAADVDRIAGKAVGDDNGSVLGTGHGRGVAGEARAGRCIPGGPGVV